MNQIRATVVEYAAPGASITQIAAALGVSPSNVRDRLTSSGDRIARLLSLSANPVTVAANEARISDVAGLLRVGPGFEIEIAPKFLGTAWENWREDFFFLSMLSWHGRLLSNDRLGTSIGARRNLATLVARAIISMFWEGHRRPLRTYRHTRIEDFVIDGEVDPESIVLPPAEGYVQGIVTYDRRNRFNAAIVGAARSLLAEVTEPQTRRQLGRVVEVLNPQDSLRVPRHRTLPSRARRWQSLHDLAIDVLLGFGVSYETAALKAPGFVLETWRVWEDLLTAALRFAWGAANVAVQRGLDLGFREVGTNYGKVTKRPVRVIPDLVRTQGSGLLIDAKYKGRVGDPKNRIVEADLYEALAFARAAQQQLVLLLYPRVARAAPDELGAAMPFERVTVGETVVIGAEVEVRGISRVGGFMTFATNLQASIGLLTASA